MQSLANHIQDCEVQNPGAKRVAFGTEKGHVTAIHKDHPYATVAEEPCLAS